MYEYLSRSGKTPGMYVSITARELTHSVVAASWPTHGESCTHMNGRACWNFSRQSMTIALIAQA